MIYKILLRCHNCENLYVYTWETTNDEPFTLSDPLVLPNTCPNEYWGYNRQVAEWELIRIDLNPKGNLMKNQQS